MPAITDQQLDRLWNTHNKSKAFDKDRHWSDFRAYPTCPPSKGALVVGGVAHWYKSQYKPDYWYDGLEPDGRAWTIPTKTYDFDDDSNLVSEQNSDGFDPPTELFFANAGWYKPATLIVMIPDELDDPGFDDWRAWLLCAAKDVEFETAGEAEMYDMWYNDSQTYWPSASRWTGAPDYDYVPTQGGMPVAGVILRNDGTTGYGRNFLPIDLTNRGRSYFWPCDMRPFNPDI